MIRGQLEAVWLEVGTDEAHVRHGILEGPDTVHAGERSDPGQTRKPVRVLLACLGYDLVRHVLAAGQTRAPAVCGT